MTGKLQHVETIINNMQQINIQKLSKGVYFFSVRNPKIVMENGKLIIN
jgi:hypothetical protein